MFFTPLLQGAAQQQAGGTGLYLRNVSSRTADSSITDPGKPANTQATDLLIAVFTSSLNPGQSAAAPAGWTAIPGATISNTTGQIYAWWALGSVASTTFTGGGGPTVAIYAFAGADTTNPIRGAATNTSDTTTIAAPSVAANAGDSLLQVWFDWQSITLMGAASPGGVIDRVNAFIDVPGQYNNRTVQSTLENLTTNGATLAQTRTCANFTGKRAATIAIAAAPTGPTIYRPTSDITTTGWTASTGSVLYDMIDEVIPSDIDYILSPDVNAAPGPATFGISSAPAGTYVISLRAMRTSSVGQIRALLKDSGGTTVGTSSWQTITGAFTTYNFSVTTTGTAAQLTIEVQP